MSYNIKSVQKIIKNFDQNDYLEILSEYNTSGFLSMEKHSEAWIGFGISTHYLNRLKVYILTKQVHNALKTLGGKDFC